MLLQIVCGRIPFVLSAAPEKYHAIITSEMRDKAERLTLDDLEDAMNDQWRLTPEGKKGDNDEDDKEGVVALSAFSGTCYKCGKSGHKALQCRSSEGRRRTVIIAASMDIRKPIAGY